MINVRQMYHKELNIGVNWAEHWQSKQASNTPKITEEERPLYRLFRHRITKGVF